MTPELDGILAVDKPVGPTSHDAVMVARRALRTRRIGHTGTLDPFASGLLLLCVGPATRVAQFLSGQPKTYQAVMRLGAATDTDDHTGTVIATSDRWQQLTAADLEAVMRRHLGPQLQVPPAYSAKKVAGERMYQRARRGDAVTPAPVGVDIHDLRLTAWSPPDAAFEVTCSSGTYVRAIARDIGAELETFSHLVALRRTAVGNLAVDDAIALDTLRDHGLQAPLIPALAAVAHLPRVDIDDAAAAAVRHGRTIPSPPDLLAGVVAIAHQDRLMAIGEIIDGRVQPRRVLHG